MKFSSISSVLALVGSVTAAPGKSCTIGHSRVPCTTIAGVKVIDTPLVRKARKLMEDNFEPFLIRHVYRTWLFGAATINNNATLQAKIDIEAHAVATLLHDLGWDTREQSPFRSSDKRFEVDAAIYAAKFIRENGVKGEWDSHRIQNVWNGISLHGTSNIGLFNEEINVAFIVESINMDFPGPHPKLTVEDYNNIVAAYSFDGLGEGTNKAFSFIAKTKPDTTYDNFLQPWGMAYVEGYNPVGHRLFDRGHPNTNVTARNVHASY